jgi:hypothetical protein
MPRPVAEPSEDVLIFLEGGGACWDGATCWGPVETALYVPTGYGAVELATDPQLAALYPLNRNDATNPWKDANLVYVPYCTGDAFAGDNVVTLNYLGIDHKTWFVGYRNIGLMLPRLLATFPNAQRVFLVGDSAGGFGAAFNFGQVQAAFIDTARVDVLDDSGQPIMPDPARWELWKKAWNVQFPADCANCTSGPGAFLDYYRGKYPWNRYGLISFAYDVVITPFMNLTFDQFHSELYAAADHVDQTWPSAHYFVLAGTSHVGMAVPTTDLRTWITKFATDDVTWASTRP